jgi:hypothetical protein
MKSIETLRRQTARITAWSEGRRAAFWALPAKIQSLSWEQDRDIRWGGKDDFVLAEMGISRGYYEYLPGKVDPVFLGTNIQEVLEKEAS